MNNHKPIRTLHGKWRPWAALVALMAVLDGCVGGAAHREGAGHADAWRLAGPFARTVAAGSTVDPNDLQVDRLPLSRAQPADDVKPESRVRVDEKFWYLDFGLRTSFPRLAWTRKQLARRLQLPLRLDVLGTLGDTTTVLDRRRDLSIHTLRLGVGRQENDWFKWNVYAGGGVWKDRTHRRTLTADLKVSFDYAIAYAGAMAAMYPFATPRYDRYANSWEHIKAGRPYLLAGLEVSYVDAEGRGQYSSVPFILYSDHESVRDWLVSGLIGLGWEIPLDSRWALDLSGHYALHFYRPEEFNGWATQIGFRYRY